MSISITPNINSEVANIQVEQKETIDLVAQISNTSSTSIFNVNTLALDLKALQSRPSQPVLKCFPYTEINGKVRAFNIDYYERFPDLEYSGQKDAVFCFPCRMFHSNI